MAAPELPDSFDVIVVGTGLVESMVAGACARARKKVLHLDTHSYYGGRNSTFDLRQMCIWLRGSTEEGAIAEADDSADSSAAVNAGRNVDVRNVSDRPTQVSFLLNEAASREAELALFPQSSRFCIDLNPQLLLCGGAMIDVLRECGVANYLEFKPMQAHLYAPAVQPGSEPPELQRVPCGKADIFQAASISLVHKRQLMKFMQTCLALQQQLDAPPAPRQAMAAPDAPPMPRDDFAGDLESSFAELAARQRLPESLRDMAMYALLQQTRPLASATDGPSAADGVRGVCRHLKSLGLYGPTAYLATYYGSSELPQAFCRLCAVWGGTYMLQSRPYSVALADDGRVEAVLGVDGERKSARKRPEGAGGSAQQKN